MTRTDIINFLGKSINAQSYLLISDKETKEDFNKIDIEVKEYHNISEIFNASEEDKKWDIIFIDYPYSCNELLNTLKQSVNYINENGYIITRNYFPANNSKVKITDGWKAINELCRNKKEVDTINCDNGISLIKKQDIDNVEIPSMSWRNFEYYYNYIIRVMDIDFFKEKYKYIEPKISLFGKIKNFFN